MSIVVKRINRQVQVVRVGKEGKPGQQGPKGDKGDQGDPATNLVQSVNGKQGVVVLNSSDVNADPTGSALQALSDAKDYTDTEVSTLDSSLATVAKTGSYDDLSDKPTIPSIAGLATEAQVQDVQDNLDAHEADTANPHSVTKAQVGLGNVDNTSDANKPVSTAQQAALNAKANASDTVNLTGNQTVAGIKTFTSTPIAPSGTSIGGVLYLTGTGFPNGVVSAPVGSIYIDKAITNGASSWIKKSGTGNTGWVVLEGDTGWRDITTLIGNGWTATQVRTRRLNNTVFFGFEALNASAITNQSMFDVGNAVPYGFKSNGFGFYSERQFLTTATNPAAVWRVTTLNNNMTIQGATNGMALLYGTLVFSTTDAYPTTLPGTAA